MFLKDICWSVKKTSFLAFDQSIFDISKNGQMDGIQGVRFDIDTNI